MCGVEMASRKIQTYQNKAKNLCTISFFVFDLDGKCKFVKQNIIVIKEIYVLLSCHLGWMNRRRFCLQKGGSHATFLLMYCVYETLSFFSLGCVAVTLNSSFI